MNRLLTFFVAMMLSTYATAESYQCPPPNENLTCQDGQWSARKQMKKPVQCASGEAKYYVVFAAYKNGADGYGNTIFCGTPDVGNSEAGLGVIENRLKETLSVKDRPQRIYILNIIPLAK